MRTIILFLLLCVSSVAFAERWRPPVEEEEKPEKKEYVQREPSPEYLQRKAQEEERVWLAKRYLMAIAQQKGQLRRNAVWGLPVNFGRSTSMYGSAPLGPEVEIFRSSCGRAPAKVRQ
jgi:hypothetical protein